jgi:hypothetical protein
VDDIWRDPFAGKQLDSSASDIIALIHAVFAPNHTRIAKSRITYLHNCSYLVIPTMSESMWGWTAPLTGIGPVGKEPDAQTAAQSQLSFLIMAQCATPLSSLWTRWPGIWQGQRVWGWHRPGWTFFFMKLNMKVQHPWNSERVWRHTCMIYN